MSNTDNNLEERRARIRRAVACPKCGAGDGANCCGYEGKDRVANHSERWAAFKQLTEPQSVPLPEPVERKMAAVQRAVIQLVAAVNDLADEMKVA